MHQLLAFYRFHVVRAARHSPGAGNQSCDWGIVLKRKSDGGFARGVTSFRFARRSVFRDAIAPVAAMLLILGGCANRPPPDGARGDAAYSVIPASAPNAKAPAYRIAPADRLDVVVFREPDLTLRNVQVDASGDLLMPLIGAVPAQGRTLPELSGDIARRYAGRYLVDPQVTVSILSSATQTVTVEGEVTQPGVYEIRGRTTLLDAIALARGAGNSAKLSEVVVFRNIDGVRNAAVFDVGGIQAGRYPDVELQGRDTVIVGFSSLRSTWRDILSAVPIIAIFRPFR